MSELLDIISNKFSQPENTSKITDLLNVVKDVVTSGSNVKIVDGTTFSLSQQDGNLSLTVGKEFLQNLGSHEITIDGSQKFTKNVNFNIKIKAELEKNDKVINFTKSDALYKNTLSTSFLDCLDDVKMVNLLKRPGLPENAFSVVKSYLQNKDYVVTVDGQGAPVQSISMAVPAQERIVIKEVPVYVDKIVLKEVPVEVQKVVIKEVIKEVPIYIENVEDDNGPIAQVEESQVEESQMDESQVDEEFSESPEESQVEESFRESEESQVDDSQVDDSQVEESFRESEDERSKSSTKKLKGRWLNDNKTILKSGQFVYRVEKKVDGDSELTAIDRWDKEQQKRVPLRKGDAKIIKKLGYKIKK